jgi:hypothetical protein
VQKIVKEVIKKDFILANKIKIRLKSFPILEQLKLTHQIIKSNNMLFLNNSMDHGCTGNINNFSMLKKGLNKMSKEKQQET